MTNPIVDIIIPAFNEELSIHSVVSDVTHSFVRHIIVVSNGSTDRTPEKALAAGAVVLHENRRGYGYACLEGMRWAADQQPPADIIVFMDGDYSDYASEMPALIAPIVNDRADLVIGSRALGNRERGSMTMPQVFGNWLATRMIRLIYGFRFTDLGPYRAIRFSSLRNLGMGDTTYGWTVEMQVKALRKNLRCTEIPVNYRKRIGVSKVSGTVKGTVMAGYKIIATILRYSLTRS
ncbi:MAG: glycosyltransferase family 2 protein [Flavobacteriales bacterium]|jgi:glycosyltransferase involved in cell wall biosynthesis